MLHDYAYLSKDIEVYPTFISSQLKSKAMSLEELRNITKGTVYRLDHDKLNRRITNHSEAFNEHISILNDFFGLNMTLEDFKESKKIYFQSFFLDTVMEVVPNKDEHKQLLERLPKNARNGYFTQSKMEQLLWSLDPRKQINEVYSKMFRVSKALSKLFAIQNSSLAENEYVIVVFGGRLCFLNSKYTVEEFEATPDEEVLNADPYHYIVTLSKTGVEFLAPVTSDKKEDEEDHAFFFGIYTSVYFRHMFSYPVFVDFLQALASYPKAVDKTLIMYRFLGLTEEVLDYIPTGMKMEDLISYLDSLSKDECKYLRTKHNERLVAIQGMEKSLFLKGREITSLREYKKSQHEQNAVFTHLEEKLGVQDTSITFTPLLLKNMSDFTKTQDLSVRFFRSAVMVFLHEMLTEMGVSYTLNVYTYILQIKDKDTFVKSLAEKAREKAEANPMYAAYYYLACIITLK